MEMTQYQRDFVRMLDSMRVDHKGEATCLGVETEECEKCPLTSFCENDICFNAEKAIEIVNNWAKEHPIVTNEDKFKEVWGREPKSAGGFYMCPSFFGLEECTSPIDCSGNDLCKEKFWHSEYKEPKKEGEANGKND